MDRSISTLVSPTELARSRQIDGLKRLVAGRGNWHRYEIDPSTSTLTFAVSFLSLFTVEGSFSRLGGSIDLRNGTRQASVIAGVPMATVDSGIGLRDRHLRSRDYLDVDRFPTAQFESSAVEWQLEGFLVHGRLTVRDETRAIVVHMSYPTPPLPSAGTDAPLELEGHFSLNRRHFGVLGTGQRRRRLDPRDLTIGNMVDLTVRVRALPVG